MTKLVGMVLGDGEVYFFRGDEYVRYDIEADRSDKTILQQQVRTQKRA